MFIHGNEPPIRRNRLITRTLYYSKNMESFATGLKRIQDSCDKAGVKVEYKADQNNFVVIFYRHCGEGWGWSADQSDISSANDSQNGTRKDEYEEAVLNAIRDNDKISRKELAELLEICVRTVSRVIQDIPQLSYKGKGKNGHWVISDV